MIVKKKQIVICLTMITLCTLFIGSNNPVLAESSNTLICEQFQRDTDNDGLYDYLEIKVSLHFNETGKYQILSTLSDDKNNTISIYYKEHMITQGIQQFSLRFNGSTIYQSHYHGKLKVSSLQVYDEKGNLTEYFENIYVTDTINHSDFERPNLYINDQIELEQIDENNNSLFDILKLKIPIEVQQAGIYSFNTILICKNKSVPTSVHSVSLKKGNHHISFSFSGQQISLFESTTLTIPWIKVFNEVNQLIVEEKISYNLSIIDPANYELAPTTILHHQITEKRIDKNNDQILEALLINVSLNIDQPGNYSLVGYLYDRYHDLIQINVTETFLNTHIQYLNLYFSGKQLHMAEGDGPYQIDIELYPSNDQTVLSKTSYITKNYTASRFISPSILIYSITTDYTKDSDGDGYYDYLIFDINLISNKNQHCQMESCLFDENTELIHIDVNTIQLEKGTQHLNLRFACKTIKNYHQNQSFFQPERDVNTSFKLPTITFYDMNGKKITQQEISYVTAAYNINDFSSEPPLQFKSANSSLYIWIGTALILLIVSIMFYFVKRNRSHK